MHRAISLSILFAATTALGGCAVIGDAADGLWSGTKSAARFVSAPVRKLLRDAPEDEVVFAETAPNYADGTYTVELYDSSYAEPTHTTTVYADAPSTPYSPVRSYGPVASYGSGQYYTPPNAPADAASGAAVPRARIDSPDQLAFVRLNGDTDVNDWRTCENLHRGYWRVDAAGGRINPDFEVCLRNKGYVRESELAIYGLQDSQPMRGSDVQARRDGYTASGYVRMP